MRTLKTAFSTTVVTALLGTGFAHGDGATHVEQWGLFEITLNGPTNACHTDIPTVLLGKGGGTIDPGRHVICPADTPIGNLWLSLMGRMGVGLERFGDSTSRLTQLTAWGATDGTGERPYNRCRRLVALHVGPLPIRPLLWRRS